MTSEAYETWDDEEDRNQIERIDDILLFITKERDALVAERDALKKRVKVLEAWINEP